MSTKADKRLVATNHYVSTQEAERHFKDALELGHKIFTGAVVIGLPVMQKKQSAIIKNGQYFIRG